MESKQQVTPLPTQCHDIEDLVVKQLKDSNTSFHTDHVYRMNFPTYKGPCYPGLHEVQRARLEEVSFQFSPDDIENSVFHLAEYTLGPVLYYKGTQDRYEGWCGRALFMIYDATSRPFFMYYKLSYRRLYPKPTQYKRRIVYAASLLPLLADIYQRTSDLHSHYKHVLQDEGLSRGLMEAIQRLRKKTGKKPLPPFPVAFRGVAKDSYEKIIHDLPRIVF